MSNLKPVKTTKTQLIAILTDILSGINADDSFGGWIEYDTLDPDLEANEFFVRASYRIGNLDGQGGMRMVHDGFLEKED